MSHYVIMIKTDPAKRTDNATFVLGKLLGRIESQGGPLNCFKGSAQEAATLISKSKAVKSVTVTHVSETSCGVWRNGVKS